MIEIHEFSTLIDDTKTSEDGLEIRRFDSFMNKTLDPVPYAIEKAILNKEFAITENTVTDEPALIGREISQNEGEWSVLAVIIRGSDTLGHHFSAYRYFYTEGKGNLKHLLHWWIDEKYPVFNPLEPAKVRFYETQENLDIPLDNFQDLLEGTSPIILPTYKPLTRHTLHAIEQKIAGENDIAYPGNVGELEELKSFHVIYPTSLEAEELISQVSEPAKESIITEHDLKIAIQNLINRDAVKLEYLEILETALSDPKINEKIWTSVFDARGVSVAISEKIYTAEMVRLLTLCAIIIPSTLPIFLGWLQAASKQKEYSNISLNFQYELINRLGEKSTTIDEIIKKISKKTPKITQKIREGVKLIITHLLEQPSLLELSICLLASPQGLWATFYHHEVKNKIDHDLSLMSEFARNTKERDSFKIPEWEHIWQQIKVFWLFRGGHNMSQYLPLAKLFEGLGNYEFSAVFYKIAIGSVPKSVFKKVTKYSDKCILYKLRISKYISKLELTGLNLLKTLRKIFTVLLNLFYFFLLIFLLLFFLSILLQYLPIIIIICIMIAILKDY